MLSLLTDPALSDVCLVVEGMDVPCHKAVLGGCFFLLRSLQKGSGARKCCTCCLLARPTAAREFSSLPNSAGVKLPLDYGSHHFPMDGVIVDGTHTRRSSRRFRNGNYYLAVSHLTNLWSWVHPT